jgi:glycosyltransferase involved in cell wall biosynthesis
MKILLISNLYPSKKYPHFGTFVKTFEDGLTSRGVEIEKIVMLKSDGYLKKLYFYFYFFLKVIIKCNFRHRDYDLIYVHYLNHSLIPFFFVNKNRIPLLVLNSHGSDIFPENKFSRKLSKHTYRILKYATKIVVPSNYFKTQIREKFNIAEQKIYISPSGGVDLASFLPKEQPQDIFTVGFLSRIEKGKRWDIIIEAANVLKKQNFLFQILIGGGGPDIEEMKQLIKALDLEKEISYLGPIPHKEVPEFFGKIDIFVFPSERKGESLGLVALESLAGGVPVICFNNGAVKEFIIDGYNGFIYEENSPNVVAEKIVNFKNFTKQNQINLSSNAHLSAKKFSNEIISQKLLAMLKSL